MLILLLILFISMPGCKKENNDDKQPAGPNELNNNTYIVDTIALKDATYTSVTIIKLNTTLRPKVGDILLGAPCAIEPYGFLRKVISVTETGTDIICVTEQSSLNEAFKELHIDATFNDSITSVKNGRIADLGDADLQYNFLNNTTFFPGLKFNGTVKLKFKSIKFRYDKSPDSYLPDYVLLRTDLNTAGSSLDVTTNGVAAINLPELTYVEFFMPDFYIYIPIPTPLGIFTLPVRCVQKAKIKGGPVSLSGKAKWVILPTLTSTLGVKYENEDWTNLSTFSMDFSSVPLLRADFNPDLSMNASFTLIKPSYEFSPYGADILKVFCEAPANISFTGQLPSPNYKLKYTINVNAGIKQKLFTNSSAELSRSIPIQEKVLLEGNWSEPHSISIIGDQQTGLANQYLSNPISVIVKDSIGQKLSNVKVEWVVVAGDGQLSQSTNYTDSNGLVTNTWKLGDINNPFGFYQEILVTVYKFDNTTNYSLQGLIKAYINVCGTDSTVTDIDGNVYKTVSIANQCWMKENLKTSRLNDGSSIRTGLSDTTWETTTNSAYSIYNNNNIYDNIYGKLYNFHAVKTGRLCPVGWHIPSKTEWTTLIDYLGGTNNAGRSMKSTNGWNPNNGDNYSGFTALPGGTRGNLIYSGLGTQGWFWSSSIKNTDFAWFLDIYSDTWYAGFGNGSYIYGLSCRCVKD